MTLRVLERGRSIAPPESSDGTVVVEPGEASSRIGTSRRRLLQQLAQLSTARVVAAGLSAMWFFIAARFLGVGAFGNLALLLALGMILGTVVDFGLAFLLADAVAIDPSTARRALSVVMRRRLLLGGACTVVLTASYIVLAQDASIVVPMVFGVSLLATAVHSSISAALRGLGRVGPEAINEVVSRLVVLVLGWLWLRSGGGLVAAVAVYALADVASVVALGITARATLPAGRKQPRAGAFSFRRAWPVATSNLVGTLYYRVDVILLSLLVGPAPVALYASSYRVLDGLLLPSNAIASMSVPVTAGANEAERRRRLFRLSLISIGLTGPAAAATALFARSLLTFLLGTRYGDATVVLRILMLGILPSAVVGVFGPRAAIGRGRRAACMLGACLGLNVVLNLLFVPAYGVVAAAWATVICQVVLMVLLSTCLGDQGD